MHDLPEYEYSPADCLPSSRVTDAEQSDTVWGVVILYPHIGPRLLGMDTKEDCEAFVAASRRECRIVSVPVPSH